MGPKSPPPPPGPRKRLLGSTVDWEPPKAAEPAPPRPSRDVPTRPDSSQTAAVGTLDEPSLDALDDWDLELPKPPERGSAPRAPALQRQSTHLGIRERPDADALRADDRETMPFPEDPPPFAPRGGDAPVEPSFGGRPNPGLGGDTDWERGGSGGHSLDLSFDAPRISDPALSLDLPEPESSEALDLVVGRTPASSIAPTEASRAPDPLAELRERYALGDFSGALTIAEGILEDDPDNADVQRYAESCRDVLMQMYAARLGSLDQIPTVSVPQEQLRWLTLDHRAGFLLSHVDGVSSLEEILDISGMPHLEAMRIIYDLLQQRVIVLQ